MIAVISGRNGQFWSFIPSVSAKTDRKTCNLIGFFIERYYANCLCCLQLQVDNNKFSVPIDVKIIIMSIDK